MSTTRHIEGIGKGETFVEGIPDPDDMPRTWKNATLTIWEGERKRLFTEEEVKAMFIDLSQKPGVSWASLKAIAAKHGLTL